MGASMRISGCDGRLRGLASRAVRLASAALLLGSSALPAQRPPAAYVAANAPKPSRSRPLLYHFYDNSINVDRYILAYALGDCEHGRPISGHLWTPSASGKPGGNLVADVLYCDRPENFVRIEFIARVSDSVPRLLANAPFAFSEPSGYLPRPTDPQIPLRVPRDAALVELASSADWTKLYYAHEDAAWKQAQEAARLQAEARERTAREAAALATARSQQAASGNLPRRSRADEDRDDQFWKQRQHDIDHQQCESRNDMARTFGAPLALCP